MKGIKMKAIIIKLSIIIISAVTAYSQQPCSSSIDFSRPEWPKNNIEVKETTEDKNIDLFVSFPNPARNDVVIDFTLEKEAKVTLAIADIEGKFIRDMFSNSALTPGRHSFTWDCRDNYKKEVSSGIYTIILGEEGKVISRKVVILK